MKKSKIEFDLVWKAVRFLTRKLDEFMGVNMDFTELTDRVACLEDEVMELVKADSVYTSMNNRIDNLERMLKTVDDRRIEAVIRADKQDEIICRLLTDMSSLATDYMDLRTIVDSHTNLHAMDNDLFKAQSNTIEYLRTAVASLVADKDALMSDSAYLYRREKELQRMLEVQARLIKSLTTRSKSAD